MSEIRLIKQSEKLVLPSSFGIHSSNISRKNILKLCNNESLTCKTGYNVSNDTMTDSQVGYMILPQNIFTLFAVSRIKVPKL